MSKNHLAVFISFIFFTLLSAFISTPTSTSTSLTSTSDTSIPFLHAKDFKGKSIVSINGSVSLTTGLDNDYYQVDSDNKTGYLYMETKLSKFINDSSKRVPLNISIVIDRSGSMEGVKLGNAKKAAKAIIAQMKPEDYVSIVIYNNWVDTIQGPVHVKDLKPINAAIDAIRPSGGTNLWDGTEQGYQFVKKNYKQGFVNRVLLISDGLANVGLIDSVLIKLKVQNYKDNEGITISTFGVGLDYNETLMTDMAETGAGNYYFIDAPEKMKSIFEKELNGLLNVAAQNAELKIKIPKGVNIKNVYPLKYIQSNDEITIKLRDLFSEETKGIVLRFTIDDKTKTNLKFSSTLRFTDSKDGSEKTVSNENLLSPIKNTESYLTHFNKPVIEQVILFTANENLERAMLLVDHSDFDGANVELFRGNQYLRYYGSYVNGSEELKKMDSISTRYKNNLQNAKNISRDSLSKMQKTNKSTNYKIRNKKN